MKARLLSAADDIVFGRREKRSQESLAFCYLSESLCIDGDVAIGVLPNQTLIDAPDSEEELTKQVIAALEGAALPANSAAAKWLQVLKRTNCVAQLREQVKTYLQRTSDDLAKTDSRDRTLQTLFDKMLARREAVLKHDLLSALNETGDKLFPVTETLIVNPHHGR